MARTGWTAAWLVAVGAVAVAALRLLAWPFTPLTIGIVALSPWLLFVVHPVLGAAIAGRRTVLTAVCVAVGTVHVAWVLPLVTPTGAAVRPADRAVGGIGAPDGGGGGALSVMSVNLFVGNPDTSAIGAVIVDRAPDVLVLVELTPWHLRRLTRTGALDAYTTALVDARPDPAGIGVFTRLPVTGSAWIRVGERLTPALRVRPGPSEARDPADGGGGAGAVGGDAAAADRSEVWVVGVHVSAPVHPRGVAAWRDELADLADVPGRLADPLVVAGDLNATEAHRPLARLLDRFTDTASVTGSGWRGTWPTNRRWPPVLRLDRILVRGLVTLEHEVGPAPGSDHRHVRAVVEVAPPA